MESTNQNTIKNDVNLNDLKNNELNNATCSENSDAQSDATEMEFEDAVEALVEEEIEAIGATASFAPQQNESPLQKLLEKQKLELAMELRRLQFANRPVSNTESKSRLEEFFTNSLNSSADSSAPTVSRRTNPEQFRTDNMRNEIESLDSQRRVQTVLQTARQQLERTLQRFVTRPAPARIFNDRPTIVTATPIVQSTPPPISTIPIPPPINQTTTYANGLHNSATSLASINSGASNNLVIQASNGSTNVFAPVTAWVPVPTPTENIRTATPVVLNTQPWLTTQATIDQIRREQIIDEISELVHQQLVSSTLESEFRQRLEQHVRTQIQSSGTDGQRTREFIRNLTTNDRVERNDFSHLGIARQSDLDNIDSASTYQSEVRGVARATVTNSRDIKNLQSELKELKNMMKLSFDLQLDMQRSLRQEIAALIAGTLVSSASAQQTSTHRSQQASYLSNITSNKPSNEGCCVICTEGNVDTVFYKCGHMSTCFVCAITLKQQGKSCPVCRAPIIDVVRTYRCNLD